jgi:hypothetical protein
MSTVRPNARATARIVKKKVKEDPPFIDKNLHRLFESEIYTRLGTTSGVLTAEYISPLDGLLLLLPGSCGHIRNSIGERNVFFFDRCA